MLRVSLFPHLVASVLPVPLARVLVVVKVEPES